SRCGKRLRLMRGIARQLCTAAEAELVMVLVFLAAPRTDNHPCLQSRRWSRASQSPSMRALASPADAEDTRPVTLGSSNRGRNPLLSAAVTPMDREWKPGGTDAEEVGRAAL